MQMTICDDGEYTPEAGTVMLSLASCTATTSDYEQAFQYGKRAANIQETLFGNGIAVVSAHCTPAMYR